MYNEKEYKHQWYKKNRDRILLKRKAYRESHREEIKAKRYQYMIQHRYKLTLPQIKFMLKNQNYKCKICSKTLSKYWVDHDHKTNKIRGLLCPSCNTFLGLAKDNITILTKAIKYLENANLSSLS